MLSTLGNKTAISFTETQKKHALFWLASFHIFVIAASNYLVQIPVTFFGINSTWGSPTYPFIFLCTDLTIRIYGAKLARKIIFCVMFPALILSYVISVLFPAGHWAGFASLTSFDIFVARIALASFTAYLLGQLLDITVFNYLRRNKSWWVAPTASTIFGNSLDTICFFSIAFHHSTNAFMAQHWVGLAFMDYAFKISICGIFLLPLYGVLLNFILKKLGKTQTTLATV